MGEGIVENKKHGQSKLALKMSALFVDIDMTGFLQIGLCLLISQFSSNVVCMPRIKAQTHCEIKFQKLTL